VVTGFYLFAKRFKKSFLRIGFWKSNLEKEEILSSLSPSNSAR
jgi:hypothetical protein